MFTHIYTMRGLQAKEEYLELVALRCVLRTSCWANIQTQTLASTLHPLQWLVKETATHKHPMLSEIFREQENHWALPTHA